MWVGHVLLLVCLPPLSHCSVVDTEYGQVRGHYVNVDNGGDPVTTVEVFNGIPYGKDTSGNGRFAKPEKREPWPDVLDALELGQCCPQADNSWLQTTHPGWDNIGEDCLNLNIHTKNVSGSHPVMFWLHGGGYSSGGNIMYPGHFLASKDLVIVSVNYRLNKFGFAYCGNSACDSNVGLWDQNLALQWVVDNIANFGGDPGRITMFGQSAGSSSAALHVLSPHSKDLFQQAIMESGAENDFWAIQPAPDNNVAPLAESLGCLGANDTESIACMRQLPWQSVYQNGTCGPFSCIPVVDGEGGFIPNNPRVLREQGDIMTGPIMTGISHDDGSYYLVLVAPRTLFDCCNRTYYEHVMMNRFVQLVFGKADNETQEDCYQALNYNYSPWPYIYDNYRNRESLETIVTDMAFGYGWDKLLKEHHTVAPTYGYVYNYRGRNTTQFYPEWMGVPHCGELPYVWGHPLLNLPSNQQVVQDSQIQFDGIYWTDEDVRHTLFGLELWANFAKYGNPTPTPVDNPLGGSTVWPEFTWDSMNVLEIKNTSIEIIQQYKQKDYAFWTEYGPYLGLNNAFQEADDYSEVPSPGSSFWAQYPDNDDDWN